MNGEQPNQPTTASEPTVEDRRPQLTRRAFIEQTAAATAAAAGFMIVKPEQVRGSQANSALRVGLLGCGGRGHADTSYLLKTGKCRVTALADLFQDKLDEAKTTYEALNRQQQFGAIDAAQIFRGPRAFEAIANSREVDIVVITSPPYFHPQHLDAVVTAGKHVYCEKPVAVDVAGCNRVLDCGRRADGRLSLEVGFQLRNAPPYVEQVRRIQSGALGDIACGAGYYFSGYLEKPAFPNLSNDERMIRNWVHYRIPSGDIIVEQDIHVIDVWNWTLGGHPLRAQASGGRAAFRPDRGNAYTNYNVVFDYPNGVAMTLSSTQFDKGWWDVAWRFFGSKGVAEAHYSGPVAIYGDQPWSWKSGPAPTAGGEAFSATGEFNDNLAQADPQKKASFVDSILSGKFHNQAAQGVESALSAMLAREAAYRHEPVSWDGLVSSDLSWDLPLDIGQFA